MASVAPRTAFLACMAASVADLLAIDLYVGPRALAPTAVIAEKAVSSPQPAPPSAPAPPPSAEPPAREVAEASAPAPAAMSDEDASGRVTGIVARFESEQANADLEQLRKLAAQLLADPGAEIVLEGHSDSNGNEYYNLSLSLDRANWARDRLADFGVPRARVRTVGLGSARPLDQTGMSPTNRRVEVRWLSRASDAGGDAWTP